MNVQKMRKMNARKTPDIESRVFDFLDSDVQHQMNEWRSRWQKHINIKHGKNIDSVNIYAEDYFNNWLKKKITMEVKLVRRN